MTLLPKQGRIILKGDAYRALVNAVLTRDEWRCRKCSSRRHLEVHHVIARSQIRLDVDWNLVTLCFECHEEIQRHRVDILGKNANETLTFRPRQSEQPFGGGSDGMSL